MSTLLKHFLPLDVGVLFLGFFLERICFVCFVYCLFVFLFVCMFFIYFL